MLLLLSLTSFLRIYCPKPLVLCCTLHTKPYDGATSLPMPGKSSTVWQYSWENAFSLVTFFNATPQGKSFNFISLYNSIISFYNNIVGLKRDGVHSIIVDSWKNIKNFTMPRFWLRLRAGCSFVIVNANINADNLADARPAAWTTFRCFV